MNNIKITVNGIHISVENTNVAYDYNVLAKEYNDIDNMSNTINKSIEALNIVSNIKAIESFGYKSTEGVVDNIKKAASNIWEKIKEFFKRIAEWFSKMFNYVKDFFEKILNKFIKRKPKPQSKSDPEVEAAVDWLFTGKGDIDQIVHNLATKKQKTQDNYKMSIEAENDLSAIHKNMLDSAVNVTPTADNAYGERINKLSSVLIHLRNELTGFIHEADLSKTGSNQYSLYTFLLTNALHNGIDAAEKLQNDYNTQCTVISDTAKYLVNNFINIVNGNNIDDYNNGFSKIPNKDEFISGLIPAYTSNINWMDVLQKAYEKDADLYISRHYAPTLKKIKELCKIGELQTDLISKTINKIPSNLELNDGSAKKILDKIKVNSTNFMNITNTVISSVNFVLKYGQKVNTLYFKIDNVLQKYITDNVDK